MFACALHRQIPKSSRASWSLACTEVERENADHPAALAQSRHLAVLLESQAGRLNSWKA